MRICVIFNPMARGEKARRFRNQLTDLAAQSVLRPTVCAGGGRALALQAVREGFDIIVAAGGDGTVNEVLNGVADPPGGLDAARFAVLPLGTVNVFAREIGMPTDLGRAWQVIVRGRETRIDLPQAEFTTDDTIHRRYFAQMAGAGWDSLAIDRVNWETKKRIGSLAYITAALRVWTGALPEITVTDGASRITGRLVLVGNGKFYGGSHRFFPLADMRNGLLDVTLFSRVDPAGVARGLAGLALNRLYTLGRAKHFKAKSLTMTSPTPVPFHLEGENVGWLPARFWIENAALRVIIP